MSGSKLGQTYRCQLALKSALGEFFNGLREGPAGATGECGMYFADDGQRDGFGRAAADVEPDRRAQPRLQFRGVGAEIAQQVFAPRGGSQQADVGHGARGERAQVVQVRIQVVAHDNRGRKVVERNGAGELGGAHFDELRRWRKARGVEIGRAMLHHRDAPAEKSRERGDRACIRSAA